jgi:hypothetical protein
MSVERRRFRPFDVPAPVARFLDDARLLIGTDSDEYVESSSRRVVDPVELRSGAFSLEIARDDVTFTDLLEAASDAATKYADGVVDLVIVASTSYLKLSEIVRRTPLDQVERVMQLTNGAVPRPFRAIHHGCDVEAYLLLSDGRNETPLEPWRKGTWLGRARYELRTGLDGAGFNILPLTDDRRAEFHLSDKTLRYVALDESPLDASSTTAVNVYVDGELLARLKREPRKSWAKAFSDQLAVDVLTAIAVRALVAANIREVEWSDVDETLLGSLIAMVGGKPTGDAATVAKRRQELLTTLRDHPHRFLGLIEGACELRDSIKFIVGGN